MEGRSNVALGWTLLGMALVLEIPGGILYSEYLNSYNSKTGEYERDGYFSLGVAFMVVGGICEIATIPLLAVGYTQKNNLLDIYNENCAGKSRVSLNLNVNSNGMGLALKF